MPYTKLTSCARSQQQQSADRYVNLLEHDGLNPSQLVMALAV